MIIRNLFGEIVVAIDRLGGATDVPVLLTTTDGLQWTSEDLGSDILIIFSEQGIRRARHK